MTDEIPSMIALAESTLSLAEETPVRSDTTTKILRGTRNKEESYVSCILVSGKLITVNRGTYSRTVLVRDEGSTKHSLYGVVHAHASLEDAESPKACMFGLQCDGESEA